MSSIAQPPSSRVHALKAFSERGLVWFGLARASGGGSAVSFRRFGYAVLPSTNQAGPVGLVEEQRAAPLKTENTGARDRHRHPMRRARRPLEAGMRDADGTGTRVRRASVGLGDITHGTTDPSPLILRASHLSAGLLVLQHTHRKGPAHSTRGQIDRQASTCYTDTRRRRRRSRGGLRIMDKK